MDAVSFTGADLLEGESAFRFLSRDDVRANTLVKLRLTRRGEKRLYVGKCLNTALITSHPLPQSCFLPPQSLGYIVKKEN